MHIICEIRHNLTDSWARLSSYGSKFLNIIYVVSFVHMVHLYLPLGSGTGTVGCSCLPLWILIVAHCKDNYFLWYNASCCSFQKATSEKEQKDLLFKLPSGFWWESGCRPQWHPERVQTWQAAWWETTPQKSILGKHLQPHTRGHPSSLSAEEATTVQHWGHVIIWRRPTSESSVVIFI